jgi:tetratricopeptide (TPR) repeat protein
MTDATSALRFPPTRRSPVGALLFSAGVAVLLAMVVVGALQWRSSTDEEAAQRTVAGSAGGSQLARLQRKVVDHPRDAGAFAALGAAYVNEARISSDPSAYGKAERALDRSVALQPDGNWQALAGQAALAAGRHDFGTALAFAEQARALQPQSSFILGITVDALTELGRYPEAVDATQAMVDLRPNLGSYARVSYQRELHGDVEGAVEAMELARQASSSAADIAFAEYYLGELAWHRGDVDNAAGHYRSALRADPTAVQALAGLGKVSAARGDIDRAIARYERAVATFPDPEVIKELGELYVVAGQPRLAEKRFGQAAAANAEQAAGGVDINLETALFSADHGVKLDDGLAAARAEWDRRHSVHVADALAWQLFAHGNYDEALTYANEALRLGTKSAQFHFHRAEIERALGQHDRARADYRTALSINPHFSFLHEARAKQALAALR